MDPLVHVLQVLAGGDDLAGAYRWPVARSRHRDGGSCVQAVEGTGGRVPGSTGHPPRPRWLGAGDGWFPPEHQDAAVEND